LLLVGVYLRAGIVHITEPGSNTLLNITGWIGIRRRPCAWWLGIALVLHGMGPREIFPLVP
jgi:succinate-acetate transporter protein